MAEEKRYYSIAEVNLMSYEDFTITFGNIVERSPLFAAYVWAHRPFRDLAELNAKFVECIDQQPFEGKEALLRLIPDLAGRLAQSGKLSKESTREQGSAGMLSLTEPEQAKMCALYGQYKAKFGFPFVICARENKKDSIFVSFEQRMPISREVEVNTSVNEVKKIAFYRLKEIFQ